MKKIKLLTPILGLSALSASLIPLATSCSKEEEKSTDKVVPTGLLAITESNHCTGLVEGADISQYDTLSIPENVKYIDDGAFDSKLPTITKLILPNSVRTIGKSTFATNSSIKTIDVSAWDAQSINYAEINCDSPVNGSFSGLEGEGKVKYNTSLPQESQKKLVKKLKDAGVPASWFKDATDGNITITRTEMTTTTTSAQFDFTLAQNLVSPASIVAVSTQTGGSDGVTIQVDPLLDIENKTITTTLHKSSAWQDGDNAEFSIKFICYADAEKTSIAWVQTVTGLKLTYKYQAKVEAISAYIDKPSYSGKWVDDEWVGDYINISDIHVKAKYEGSTQFVDVSSPKTWYDADKEVIGDTYQFSVKDLNVGYKTINVVCEGCECSLDITVDPPATEEWLEFHAVTDSEGTTVSYEVSLVNALITEDKVYISIPSTHNGLPVTGFYGEDSFSMIRRSPGKLLQRYIFGVYIPNTITEIPSYTFAGQIKLSQVVFAHGSKLTKVDDYAFGETNIGEAIAAGTMVFPETVNYFGRDVFYECKIKTSVKDGWYYLPNGDNPYYMIYGAPTADHGDIDENCKFIGLINGVNITSETEIVIPEGIVGIAGSAFVNFPYLEKLTLPESLISIGTGAFAQMELDEPLDINIPKNVSYIPGNPFLTPDTGGLTKLQVMFNITIDPENKNYELSDDSVLYGLTNGVRTTLIGSIQGSGGTIVIENTIKELARYALYGSNRNFNTTDAVNLETIGTHAIAGLYNIDQIDLSPCTKITELKAGAICDIAFSPILGGTSSLILPKNIKELDTLAIQGIEKCDQIVLPTALKTINTYAFYEIYECGSIVLPEGLETIEAYAFDDISLEGTVNIPSSCKYIGLYAFNTRDLITIEDGIEFADPANWLVYDMYGNTNPAEEDALADPTVALNYMNYLWGYYSYLVKS